MRRICRTQYCQNYNKDLDDDQVGFNPDRNIYYCKNCFLEIELVAEDTVQQEIALIRPLPPKPEKPPQVPEEKELTIEITGAPSFPVLELWYEGEKQVEQQIIGDNFLIGRPSSKKDIHPDLDLSSYLPEKERKEVSRLHARIFQQGGAYFIEDCRSKNGTYLLEPGEDASLETIDIETKRLEPETPRLLKNGSLIIIGQNICGLKFLWSEN